MSGPGALSRPSDLSLLLAEETRHRPAGGRSPAGPAERAGDRGCPRDARSPERPSPGGQCRWRSPPLTRGRPASQARCESRSSSSRPARGPARSWRSRHLPRPDRRRGRRARLASNPAPDFVVREIGASSRAWTGCERRSRSGPQGWIEVGPESAISMTRRGTRNWRPTPGSGRARRAASRRDHRSAPGPAEPALLALARGPPRGTHRRDARDDLTRVNRLGLELASRTLLNAQPLGPEVALAASLLLERRRRGDPRRIARLLGTSVR